MSEQSDPNRRLDPDGTTLGHGHGHVRMPPPDAELLRAIGARPTEPAAEACQHDGTMRFHASPAYEWCIACGQSWWPDRKTVEAQAPPEPAAEPQPSDPANPPPCPHGCPGGSPTCGFCADEGIWIDGPVCHHDIPGWCMACELEARQADCEHLTAQLASAQQAREEAENRAGTRGNMLRYIAFVAAGDESADVQLAVDRLKAARDEARTALAAKTEEVEGLVAPWRADQIALRIEPAFKEGYRRGWDDAPIVEIEQRWTEYKATLAQQPPPSSTPAPERPTHTAEGEEIVGWIPAQPERPIVRAKMRPICDTEWPDDEPTPAPETQETPK